MRNLGGWVGFCAGAVVWVAACSSPATVIQGDTIVVNEDAGPGVDAGMSDALLAHQPDASDGGTDSSTSDDATTPIMCTGTAALGVASLNCAVLGPCQLSTCAQGTAYACYRPDGSATTEDHPANLTTVVFSSTDSAMLGGTAHCGEAACVRLESEDGNSCTAGKVTYSCATGITPSVAGKTCVALGVSPGIYCCS